MVAPDEELARLMYTILPVSQTTLGGSREDSDEVVVLEFVEADMMRLHSTVDSSTC